MYSRQMEMWMLTQNVKDISENLDGYSILCQTTDNIIILQLSWVLNWVSFCFYIKLGSAQSFRFYLCGFSLAHLFLFIFSNAVWFTVLGEAAHIQESCWGDILWIKGSLS